MAGLLALIALSLSPALAGASSITPCVAGGQPDAPVTEIDGQAIVEPQKSIRRQLKKAGVRIGLSAPANSSTGRPTFPVSTVAYGSPLSKIALRGGLKLTGRKSKKALFTGQVAEVNGHGTSYVKSRFGGTTKRLFSVRGGKVSRNETTGEMYLTNGRAQLSGAAASFIRKRFGRKALKGIKGGSAWGRINIYTRYLVTQPSTDPEAEVPEVPPVAVRPEGWADLVSASINWRVRDSFIRYISSGDGASAIDGAVPGTAEGSPPLIYEFSFPFTSGWSDTASSTAVLKGSGGVAFRYCRNTINFHVNDPELELNGDSSRLIFRVQGTDGTAFPDQRAVMVGLKLSQAASVATVGNTTTYTDVPGFVPTGSAGIFAEFYMPGAEFGNMDISYTAGP